MSIFGDLFGGIFNNEVPEHSHAISQNSVIYPHGPQGPGFAATHTPPTYDWQHEAQQKAMEEICQKIVGAGSPEEMLAIVQSFAAEFLAQRVKKKLLEEQQASQAVEQQRSWMPAPETYRKWTDNTG